VARSRVHRRRARHPGAPWRIRVDDELRARFVENPPPGWLTIAEARKALGVSRQTVLQRVKRGELNAVHVRTGRRKGLRIQVIHKTSGCSTPHRDNCGSVDDATNES